MSSEVFSGGPTIPVWDLPIDMLEKIILLFIGSREGRNFTIGSIAECTRLSPRTVQRKLALLADAGYLEITSNFQDIKLTEKIWEI